MVTKKLLILSHGQATVECGFSINIHVAVENLKEESLVAQRIVHDAITTAGGVCQMPVTKSMLSYAQGARQRYMAYLEAEKEKVLKQNIEQNFNSKRKRECEEAEKMEAKKRRLNQDMVALVKSADELATSAELTGDLALVLDFVRSVELTGDLTLLAKSSAMRKSATKKSQALKDLH